jgi:hypothetical protein
VVDTTAPSQGLWYYLLVSRLDQGQMCEVGTTILSACYKMVGRRLGYSLVEGRVVPVLDSLQADRFGLDRAARALVEWETQTPELTELLTEIGQIPFLVEVEQIRSLFCLPWAMPRWVEEPDPLSSILAEVCAFIDQYGLYPVGLDEKFTVAVNFPSEQHPTQLFMEFCEREDGDLFAQIACPDVGVTIVWASGNGMRPTYIGIGSAHICPIQEPLGLNPTMSRCEIEKALNTLTFTAENPDSKAPWPPTITSEREGPPPIGAAMPGIEEVVHDRQARGRD